MTLLRVSPFWASGGAFVLLAAASAGAPPRPSPPKGAAAKPAARAAASPGEKVYRQQCAPCHGAKGEGTPAFPRALAGDRSVGQLARYIAAQMPPGPKKCSAPDAQKVAAYVHEAFYSPLAQERNRPARVALSRLTVRQYRNAVADLIGSFRGGVVVPGVPQAEGAAARGLRAEYFKAKRFRPQDRVLERVDPEVKFDFGAEGPVGGAFDPHQFSARWQGSVVAADTGVYEFVVRTDHGARLWVNDDRKPLIDAGVKSGNDTEYRGSLYLVGGRAYPLRLEFSKSTQGVDDSDKKKGKPAPKAFVTLAWKRPKQAEEPIPAHSLLPAPCPPSFVVTAPFPPDDRSMGYERGDAVSRAWDEATTSAALETADYVIAHLRPLAGVKNDGTPEDAARLRAFCRKFVERGLRRPLDADTEKRYVTRQFEASPDPETAVKRVVLLTLKSPRFLYREAGADAGDPYAVASRLSFALWDSLPDDALLRAASSGGLATREQITAQAERMARDPRAWYKQREFFLQWLKLDQYPDLTKDAKRFPAFTPQVAADLRTSLDLTLESIARSDRADFRELLLSDRLYLNGRLAALYGARLTPDAPFQPVTINPGARAGVLTHPYVLASFAYLSTSSPIHRGVLVARSVLGRVLPSPPEAFTPLAADLHPRLTTRQRVALQTKPANCVSCHGLINPLGFTMERFDAIGRFRTAENGAPVDATGGYEPRVGPRVKFNGARDLARYAAASDEAQSAFVEKLFQYAVKQPVRAYGPRTLPGLKSAFAKSGYNMRRLLVEIAVQSAHPSAVRTAKAE